MTTATRLLVCALCALVLVGCGDDDDTNEAATSEPPAWNHDPDDADLGPDGWGNVDRSFQTCGTGLSQSPVDLVATLTSDLPGLELDYPPAPVVVENTGHTIEVPLPEDGGQTMTIGDEAYQLLQFHFHAPSEHTVDGRSFDAEVHLVHESADGELAVLGVLLEQGDPSLPLADQVIAAAPEDAGEEAELDEERSAAELFLALDATTGTVDGYSAYPGSLTTPPCAEGVRWFVRSEPTPISADALDRLHELVAGFPNYGGYENNNRPTHPLNDRGIGRDG